METVSFFQIFRDAVLFSTLACDWSSSFIVSEVRFLRTNVVSNPSFWTQNFRLQTVNGQNLNAECFNFLKKRQKNHLNTIVHNENLSSKTTRSTNGRRFRASPRHLAVWTVAAAQWESDVRIERSPIATEGRTSNPLHTKWVRRRITAKSPWRRAPKRRRPRTNATLKEPNGRARYVIAFGVPSRTSSPRPLLERGPHRGFRDGPSPAPPGFCVRDWRSASRDDAWRRPVWRHARHSYWRPFSPLRRGRTARLAYSWVSPVFWNREKRGSVVGPRSRRDLDARKTWREREQGESIADLGGGEGSRGPRGAGSGCRACFGALPAPPAPLWTPPCGRRLFEVVFKYGGRRTRATPLTAGVPQTLDVRTGAQPPRVDSTGRASLSPPPPLLAPGATRAGGVAPQFRAGSPSLRPATVKAEAHARPCARFHTNTKIK